MSFVIDPTEMAPAGGQHEAGANPRLDLTRVIAALGEGLTRGTTARDLLGIFEQSLSQTLAIRAVRLREIPARYQARLVTPTQTTDSIVLGVPTGDPHVQAVLEAAYGPERALDERDREILVVAAQLGGLVLEAVRSRTLVRPRTDGSASLIGSSTVMNELRSHVERVACTDFTVLVEGESGTGKELVARQLHELSRRHNGPFVAVNCAAVVDTLLEAELFGIEDRTATGVRGRRGKFEHAEGGTLFLDEVSDLSVSAQAKLLRAIQDVAVERVGSTGIKRVNTRIVVATNRPLADMVDRGLFRSDLFYRLSGVEIQVPPLRRRRDDIPELVAHFLGRHRHTRELALSAAAEEALRLYDWPGNVRELERVVERAIALAERDTIDVGDLPPRIRGVHGEVVSPALHRGDTMRAWGSRYARMMFERCGRNKRRTCRVLDISYHTLQAYLRYADRTAAPTSKSLPAWATGEATERPQLTDGGRESPNEPSQRE